MFGAGPIQRSPCGAAVPVARWSFDDGPGATGNTTAHDSIGDNHGTLTNMDPINDWIAGNKVGWALDFDGQNDYVSLSYPVGALTSDSVTISAWVKPAAGLSAEVYYPVFTQFHYNPYTQEEAGYYLSLHGYWPDFFLNEDCHITSSSAIGYNDWYWLVGTYDGETIKIFINGQESNSVTSSGYSGIYSNAYIGFNGYTDNPRYFPGKIDDVWVYACAWNPDQDCYPVCDPNYLAWVAMGKPSCWCGNGRQCHGDADGLYQGSPTKGGIYYVGTNDLNVLMAAWQVKEPPWGPGIASVQWNGIGGICADFFHDAQGSATKGGLMRVSTNDLNILLANWMVREPPFGLGVPADCLNCGRGQQAQAKQFSFEEIMKWVEKVQLSPDIQKELDEEAWLKFVESLKKSE
jgi:hypothetical protein